jgi:pyridoxamine 5'-phosphate oxidase
MLSDRRRNYERAGLDESDVAADPFEQFDKWLREVIDSSPGEWFEPTAMTLATAAHDGRVSARIVLLKEIEPGGLVFYTNYGSDKADDVAANPQAALCFYWGTLERQVRIEGAVEKVAREKSAAYFATRPRRSQLGAAVSNQSRVVADRGVLEQALAAAEAKYEGVDIPLPENWGGYRLVPASFEFWQGRRDRLHDRIRYRRAGDVWVVERLSP